MVMETLQNKFWQPTALQLAWQLCLCGACDKDALFIMWLEEVILSCFSLNETIWSSQAQQNLNVCLKTWLWTCCPSSSITSFPSFVSVLAFSYIMLSPVSVSLSHSHPLINSLTRPGSPLSQSTSVIMYESNLVLHPPRPSPPSPSSSLTLLSSQPVVFAITHSLPLIPFILFFSYQVSFCHFPFSP